MEEKKETKKVSKKKMTSRSKKRRGRGRERKKSEKNGGRDLLASFNDARLCPLSLARSLSLDGFSRHQAREHGQETCTLLFGEVNEGVRTNGVSERERGRESRFKVFFCECERRALNKPILLFFLLGEQLAFVDSLLFSPFSLSQNGLALPPQVLGGEGARRSSSSSSPGAPDASPRRGRAEGALGLAGDRRSVREEFRKKREKKTLEKTAALTSLVHSASSTSCPCPLCRMDRGNLGAPSLGVEKISEGADSGSGEEERRRRERERDMLTDFDDTPPKKLNFTNQPRLALPGLVALALARPVPARRERAPRRAVAGVRQGLHLREFFFGEGRREEKTFFSLLRRRTFQEGERERGGALPLPAPRRSV